MADESGFKKSLTLGQIKDSVADVRHQAEMCFGMVMGDVLWLHEKYAPSGGWDVAMLEPDGKNRIQTITADDIGKHQKVAVTITPALPQDLLQIITNRNMLTTRDPLTGMVATDPETADEITGLADVIGDYTQARERKERDFLLSQDPEMKALYSESLKVKNEMWIREMKKTVERAKKKSMRRQVIETARDIEDGLTEDIVLPADILADPAKLHQFASLVEKGQTPQAALDILQQGMPLGMPGEMVAEGMGGQQPPPGGSPDIEAIMAQLMGQQAQPQQPNGFTGYEGVNPMAAPAAMMGALPRTVLDQPALQVEAVNTLQQRGAKPHAR